MSDFPSQSPYSFTQNKPNRELERSSIAVMVAISSVVLAAAIQIISWDKYALDMMPVLFREITGMTTPQDTENKARMCWELKKWDCVESEYTRAAQNDRKLYSRLGHYQMRRLKFDKAAASFQTFFKFGGEDMEAAGAYAKALAAVGHFDEASKYFNLVLESRPESLQVPVVVDYVKMLMKSEKFEQAQRLIEDVRRQYPAGSQFMDSEYKQIKNLVTASR